MAAGVSLARAITTIGGCIRGTSSDQLMNALMALGCGVRRARWPLSLAQNEKYGVPPIDNLSVCMIVSIRYSKPGERPYRGHWFLQHGLTIYDPGDPAPVEWWRHHSALGPRVGRLGSYLVVSRRGRGMN